MQHCLEELRGSLLPCTLFAGPTHGMSTALVAAGDPVWQEALVQHGLEEPQGFLQLFTLAAGINQGVAH